MRYVTRTMKQTVVATKSVDNESMKIVDFHVVLGNVKPNAVEKETKKALEELGFTLVKIVGVTKEDVKYRMSEETFIKNAEEVK